MNFAYEMGSLNIWKRTIYAERYIEVLDKYTLPSRQQLFQGRSFVFQQDTVKTYCIYYNNMAL